MDKGPRTQNPEIEAFVVKAVARYNAMSESERRLADKAQRRSWVIGEMMLEHEDMTRQEAERLVDRVL